MKLRIVLSILLATSWILITPKEALAVIQNLNGQTGQTQSFQNDPNIVINSLNNIHSINWQGLMPLSRGGTGNDSFEEGSVIFMGQNKFRQDKNNFFWDRINNRLGIGTSSPSSTLDVFGATSISGNLNIGEVTGFVSGVTIKTSDGIPDESQGVDLSIVAGNGGSFGTQGDFSSGGSISIISGNAGSIDLVASDALGFNNNGGDVSLSAGNGSPDLDVGSVGGNITIEAGSGSAGGNIALFPGSGTVSGLVMIEASSNSTLYVGSSVKSGCIALGDSDGNGITYITANDGVLTASSTKPNICQ